jgi:hypothetical protein
MSEGVARQSTLILNQSAGSSEATASPSLPMADPQLFYSAEPDSSSADGLRSLASWAATHRQSAEPAN